MILGIDPENQEGRKRELGSFVQDGGPTSGAKGDWPKWDVWY